MVLLQLLSEDKKKKKLLSVDKDAQFKDVYDQALTTPLSLCSTFFTTGVIVSAIMTATATLQRSRW